jgi:hypothetical protein
MGRKLFHVTIDDFYNKEYDYILILTLILREWMGEIEEVTEVYTFAI